jgi:2-polyprenyl-6-methoxyphenol hydroxylase-like FAD-dependent oxidoreductase
MACALASTGWRVLLVERSADPIDTARGDHLQPHTCEWLNDWSVLDDMWARGAQKRLGARYLTPTGETVLHVPCEQLDIPFRYFLYLNHELICDVLLAGAARNPAFELWRPAAALPLVGDDGCSLRVEHDGEQRDVRARLVVAADGRVSRFRRAMGIEADSYSYQNPLLTYFAERTLDDPRNEVRAYFSDVGVISVVPRGAGHWKIGLPVPASDVARWKEASPNEVAEKFAEWLPDIAGVRPRYVGVYPVTRTNAERWSEANVVLLGDACNTLHPGRSQGMNVAMRAANRLAQLLVAGDAMASRRALRDVLEAYEAEVKPPMDARLADNHERGLEMDRLDPAETDRMRAKLAAVAADPALHAKYCAAAAGY